MTEQFNRIVKQFGGNRVRLLEFGEGYLQFEIAGWATFLLARGGVFECWGGERILTGRSHWLWQVSEGLRRDDEGRLCDILHGR